MRNTMHKLLEDAKEAGYIVRETSSGTIEIFKAHPVTKQILRGLVIFPNGTGFDATVNLSVAKSIRGVLNFRNILRLA